VLKTTDQLPPPSELLADQFDLILRKLADDLTYGSDASRFVGSGIDFAQSRPFAFGDSVRHIDWRVTARTGKLFVKEYEATKRIGVYLLVDTSASMAVSSTPLSKHDIAVWSAAVLALVSLRRRSPVSILSCGDRETSSAPTLSRAHVWRAIEELRQPSHTEQTRLTQAISQVEAMASYTSSVIIISDLHDPRCIPAIKRLAQRHDVLVLRPQDPAERALRAGFVRAQEAESGSDFLATPRTRWNTLTAEAQLTSSAINCTPLLTDQPLIPAIRRALDLHGGGARKSR
jgi:uncharacterized protein (DUF58 family)